MSNNTFMSEKKRALLAHKEKILQELQYYEKRIEDERSKGKVEYYLDDHSSDSDDDICLTDQGLSLTQLKLEQSQLKTCLQATHELTSLQILQSEVNVMVNEPGITGEPPVKEPGTWREVTAECRIDLVPFSITFYVHKANAKFGASSYRGLNVMLVKAAHDAELSKSVLPTVVRPSDAVEVLRSYAEAYRSRRSTLARLATKYADSLFMEPLAEGGYLLKCANLLQVAWRLENKWSPLAPFHHRMKFDLEYMEEKYINIITQCHKQLSDPTISTDERTLLLSKIIATCLEANPVSESAESDHDAGLPKRRATLDQEIEEPENKKRKEIMAPPKSFPKKAKVSKNAGNSRSNDNSGSNSAMADNQQGDKENVDNNVGIVTAPAINADNRGSVLSGSKSSQKAGERASKNVASSKKVESVNNKITENNATESDPKNKNKKQKSTTQTKNSDKKSDSADKVIKNPQTGKKLVITDKNKKVINNKHNADSITSKKSNNVVDSTKNDKVSEENGTSGASHKKQQKDVVTQNNKNAAQGGKDSGKKLTEEKNKEDATQNDANENILSAKISKPIQSNKFGKQNINVNSIKKVQANEKGEKSDSKVPEKSSRTGSAQKAVEKNANKKPKDNLVDIAKTTTEVKSVESVKNKGTNKGLSNKDPVNMQRNSESNDVVLGKTKKLNNEKNANKNSVANVKNKMNTNKFSDDNNDPFHKQKLTETKEDASAKTKNSITGKLADKNINSNEKNKLISNVTNAHKNFEKAKICNQKTKSQENLDKGNDNTKKSDHTKKSVLPLRMQNNFKMTRKSIGNIKVAATKENDAKIKSKIPQKKFSPVNQNVLKKNPLRMSPRHLASTFNTTSSLVKQSIQKPTTNIPRLAKPMVKAK